MLGRWLNLIKEGAQELDVCVQRTPDLQATPVGFLPLSVSELEVLEWRQPGLLAQQLAVPTFALSVTSCHLPACSAVWRALPGQKSLSCPPELERLQRSRPW